MLYCGHFCLCASPRSTPEVCLTKTFYFPQPWAVMKCLVQMIQVKEVGLLTVSFVREVLSHASFNLRKLITSSHVLRERMKSKGESDQTHTEEHKVLDVRWNVQSDQ